MTTKSEQKLTSNTINTMIISIFASAILGLGGSHIYVLNKLAANEVRITSNEKAVERADERYYIILEKLNESELALKGLTTQIEQLNRGK